MNDSDIDSGIRTELDRLADIDAFVRARPDHHAEPNSDLADDESRFPDIWAATAARRGLIHSCECVEAASFLILNGDWTSPQFALLRAAYEAAAAAMWMLVPEEPDTRLARLLWQHHDSWRYSEKAYRGAPLDISEQQRRQRWAAEAAANLGIDLRSGNPGGFEKLIESVDELPQHPESLLTAWRLCSGVSHAKTWALNEVTTEIGSIELYEHGRVSQRTPDLQLFLTDLAVARRAVQRAWGLYRIRTTRRPHDLVLRLELRDRDGNAVHDGS